MAITVKELIRQLSKMPQDSCVHLSDANDLRPCPTGDGVTDDTAALQYQLDESADSGAPVILGAGKIYKITSELVVPDGVRIIGQSRKTKIRSYVPAGQYAIKFDGQYTYTAGGLECLTLEVMTVGSGGIRLLDCTGTMLRDFHVAGGAAGARRATVGILIAGTSIGSQYCRLDGFSIYGCSEAALKFDTTFGVAAWSNRHVITGANCWQCAVGILFEAGSTCFVQCATESCDRPLVFKIKSRRNYVHLIDENNVAPIQIDSGAVDNVITGIFDPPEDRSNSKFSNDAIAAIPRLTTAARDAITTPHVGVILNSTTGKLNYWDGSAWQALR